MALRPNSTVKLYYGVEIDNDERVAFSSAQNRDSYFEDHILDTFENVQGIKKENGFIELNVDWLTVNQANYMSFINPRFGNKIYYCHIIVDPDFSTNKTAYIHYQIDWLTTEMDTMVMDICNVDREYLSESDYEKVEENPYDPTVIEMRTPEPLPISQDVEKPFYSLGFNETDDGIFCGEKVADELGLDNSVIGALVVLSDIDWKDADTGTSPKPGQEFYNLLNWMRGNDGGLCAYKISYSTMDYLDSEYSQTPRTLPMIGMGPEWQNSLGNMVPFNNTTFDAPNTLLYFECASSTTDSGEKLSELLALLTTSHNTDAILGIYPVGNGIMPTASTRASNVMVVGLFTADTIQDDLVNKKLDLYPFSYYRLIAPNGDIKELRMEDFHSAQVGDQICYVSLNMDVIEKPVLMVSPVDYKIGGISPHNSVSINNLEGLIFTQWPTMAYAIDAYLSQVASVTMNTIGNNTVLYRNDLEMRNTQLGWEAINTGIETVGGVGKAAGQLVSKDFKGAAETFMGMAGTMEKATVLPYKVAAVEGERMMSESAYSGLTGGETSITKNLQYTKPAYACNEYHPINGDGISNYNQSNFQDIIFMRVSLNPKILSEFDKWFTLYGYQSSRTKLPYIYNFFKGSSNNDELPHWNTLNGRQVTYVKTNDAKFIGMNMVAAAYIRQVFNNGVRFINGDELISGGL